MGSFASTCCVSGLSIQAGDPVRWFLLRENKFFDGGFVCDIAGRWVPISWPIRAKYNDYGSIEEVNPSDGPLVEALLEMLRPCLVEKGTGDNSCHDVPVRKDMDFKALLEAVWEGRLEIGQAAGSAPTTNWVPPKYIPTLSSVEAALGELAPVKILVDDLEDCIRVRVDGMTDGKSLDLALEVIRTAGFAGVIVAGSGSYADEAELRVFVAPGKTDGGGWRCLPERRAQGRSKWNRPLLVQQAMIREDVWQAICTLPFDHGSARYMLKSSDKPIPTAAQYVDSAVEGLIARQERRATIHSLRNRVGEDLHTTNLFAALRDFDQLGSGGHRGLRFFSTSGEIFYTQIAEHGDMVLDTLTPADFAVTVGEFTYIADYLSLVRHVWRPSDTAGPQFAEYNVHRAYLAALAEVAAKVESDHLAEYGEADF